MTISVSHISKKFGKQTIIRDFSYSFLPNKRYVITGPNGSGKSTLLKIVAGCLSPDSGTVEYVGQNGKIETPDFSIYAPYIAPPNDFTVIETIRFHACFKRFSISEANLLEQIKLVPEKKLTELSSGMKQRLQLALVFFSESAVIFLDEPTSFFDKEWKEVYHTWLNAQNCTVILSSNDENEYTGFDNVIKL
jgi:ABC-type multidrug transport system ATPase subunit